MSRLSDFNGDLLRLSFVAFWVVDPPSCEEAIIFVVLSASLAAMS